MARNDPFSVAAFDVADTGTFVIDGSGSSTGAAIVSGLSGNANAEIRLQAYDGGASAWKTVSLLEDDSGNITFAADWNTQFNRLIVNGGGSPSDGELRIEVTNVSGGSGDYAADGDER